MSQMSSDVLVRDRHVPNPAAARMLRTIVPACVVYRASPLQPNPQRLLHISRVGMQAAVVMQ